MTSPVLSNIAVVGAGALGSLFGGMLARAGVKVTLIGRSAHVDAMITVTRLNMLRRPSLAELARALETCPTIQLGVIVTAAEAEAQIRIPHAISDFKTSSRSGDWRRAGVRTRAGNWSAKH